MILVINSLVDSSKDIIEKDSFLSQNRNLFQYLSKMFVYLSGSTATLIVRKYEHRIDRWVIDSDLFSILDPVHYSFLQFFDPSTQTSTILADRFDVTQVFLARIDHIKVVSAPVVWHLDIKIMIRYFDCLSFLYSN